MRENILLSFSKGEFKELLQEFITDFFSKSENKKYQTEGDLLKIKEVCNLLKVSPVTIHKWKREGRIPFLRISNRIFFKRSEILEALKTSDFSQRKGGKI